MVLAGSIHSIHLAQEQNPAPIRMFWLHLLSVTLLDNPGYQTCLYLADLDEAEELNEQM